MPQICFADKKADAFFRYAISGDIYQDNSSLDKHRILHIKISYSEDESKIYALAMVWRKKQPVQEIDFKDKEIFVDNSVYTVKILQEDGSIFRSRDFDFVRSKIYNSCADVLYGPAQLECKPYEISIGQAEFRMQWNPKLRKIQVFKGSKKILEEKIKPIDLVQI